MRDASSHEVTEPVARMRFVPRLKIEVGRECLGGDVTLTFRSREGIVAMLAEAQGLLADWDRAYPS